MSDGTAIRVIFVEDDADVRLGSTQALELAGTSSRSLSRRSSWSRWCGAPPRSGS